MAEITLDDLKQELKNLNIQVGNVHESSCRLDSKLDNSLVSAVVYPIQFIEQHAPKLAQLIRQSVIDVNGASNIDGDSVESPLSVSVVFKGDYAETFAIGNSENGSALTIGYNAFCNRSDVADVKSVLDHEFGHLIPDSPADKKSAELRSDRYANAMDRIRSLLYEISHQAWQYDFDSTNKTHPNNRERIRALLEEAFGNALALSDVQRKVAQYVLDNIREYQFLSSAENSQTM